MEDNLEPCPFCRGKAEASRGLHKYDYWAIWCLTCGVRTGLYARKCDAIKAWNTRYERTTPADKLLCRHCGYSIVYQDGDDMYTWDYCPHCGVRIVD